MRFSRESLFWVLAIQSVVHAYSPGFIERRDGDSDSDATTSPSLPSADSSIAAAASSSVPSATPSESIPTSSAAAVSVPSSVIAVESSSVIPADPTSVTPADPSSVVAIDPSSAISTDPASVVPAESSSVPPDVSSSVPSTVASVSLAAAPSSDPSLPSSTESSVDASSPSTTAAVVSVAASTSVGDIESTSASAPVESETPSSAAVGLTTGSKAVVGLSSSIAAGASTPQNSPTPTSGATIKQTPSGKPAELLTVGGTTTTLPNDPSLAGADPTGAGGGSPTGSDAKTTGQATGLAVESSPGATGVETGPATTAATALLDLSSPSGSTQASINTIGTPISTNSDGSTIFSGPTSTASVYQITETKTSSSLSHQTIALISVGCVGATLIVLGVVFFVLHKTIRPSFASPSSQSRSEFGGFSEWDDKERNLESDSDRGSLKSTRSIRTWLSIRTGRLGKAETPPSSPGPRLSLFTEEMGGNNNGNGSGGLKSIGMARFGGEGENSDRERLVRKSWEDSGENVRRQDGAIGLGVAV